MNVVGRIWPHRRAFFLLLLLLLASGVGAMLTLAQSIYPHVEFSRIAVIIERGEEPVRAMLVQVTRPVEQAVGAVPGLARLRSKTVRGGSEFSLDFRTGSDMPTALSLVRARVAQAGLPSDAGVTIEQQTPAVFPVISVNVIPGDGARENPVLRARLAEWVEMEVRPRLARLPDAFFVTVQASDVREYVFEVDPTALAQSGVDIADVEETIAAGNEVAAIGRSMSEGLQYQILVDGRLRGPGEILDLAVPRTEGEPVLLSALGRVVEGTRDRTTVVTGGGREAVVVSVFLRDGGKVTDLSRDVAAVLDEISPSLPEGARIEPVYDQAILVRDSIAGVRDAIAIGAALAVVVMFFFLGSWRVTVVAGLAIPISVILTFALFPLFGESLNLMSLGGLAVAIGLIIDDAIVVVENVARRLAGKPADLSRVELMREVAAGTQEVFGAIVGSSLTTVVVFLPLVLLEGVVGQFFRSLALALGASILASMVVSLIYSPLMLLLPGLAPRGGLTNRRWTVRLQDGYANTVRRILSHRGPFALIAVLFLIAGAVGLRGIPTGFLPEMDEGGFVLDYSLPVGSSLEETDAACRRIERILLETPEVAAFSRRTGAELGFFTTEQFTGDFLVGLSPRESRHSSVFDVMDRLRDRLAREVPQAETEFIQVMQDTIADLSGSPAPIEVKFLGADYPELQRAADQAESAIDGVSGVVDVLNHVSFGSPELVFRPDPVRTAALGLSVGRMADEASREVLGGVASSIQEGDRFVPVRVRYPEGWRGDGSTDGDGPALFVRGPSTSGEPGLLLLSSVAGFERRLAENELERENQVPMVRVTASVAGRDLGSANRAVEQAVAAIPLDPSVRVEFGGQAASQTDAFGNLLIVFGLGTGLVLLLLVVQFRSLSLPLVMFLAMPFGQVGGLYALKLTGVPLNISSGMGLIMLVGLVVKNGIIMIEYAQALRREGLSDLEAIIGSARARLRPILMTTLAAIAGLLPLALGVGAGSELQRPLAIAVIGGLVVSTTFTLVVVPLGCAILARGRLIPEVEHVF